MVIVTCLLHYFALPGMHCQFRLQIGVLCGYADLRISVVVQEFNLYAMQVRFTFSEAGLQLHYPAVYTTCTQMLSNGSCVFPAPCGNAWLSARLITDMV